MSSPRLIANVPQGQRARTWRPGGALRLIGGAGTLGALFLPWLSLTLISEEICSSTTCVSTPDSASLRGWEIFAHPFLLNLLLPLLALSALVNLAGGALRLRASGWSPIWFWGALLVTSAALAAFIPWLITFPFPRSPNLVDGHATGYQYAFGLYIAVAAGLASFVGVLLELERREQPSPAPMTMRERHLSRGLALVALALLLVFVAFFLRSVILPAQGGELAAWDALFFLIIPPIVAGLALIGLVRAYQRRQRAWTGLLCLAFTHACLGWAYALLVTHGDPSRLDTGDNVGMLLTLLWGAYLCAVLLCLTYAALPRFRGLRA